MSNVLEETNTFLARDGLYYATYQEMRNANVRDNEKRLKALGLEKNWFLVRNGNMVQIIQYRRRPPPRPSSVSRQGMLQCDVPIVSAG
jgi:hypothetical protein